MQQMKRIYLLYCTCVIYPSLNCSQTGGGNYRLQCKTGVIKQLITSRSMNLIKDNEKQFVECLSQTLSATADNSNSHENSLLRDRNQENERTKFHQSLC